MSAASTIAGAISTRLATITVDNDFATDIGSTVYRGKRRLSEDDVPCTILLEGDDNPKGDTLRSVQIAQRYHIESHAACDPDNPNDMAHLMIADLKKAIFGTDPTFGRTIRKIEYVGRAISPREDGTAIVAAGITVDVVFVEDLTNP